MRSRRKRVITVVALLAAFALAACGGPGTNDAIGLSAPPGTELPAVSAAPSGPGSATVPAQTANAAAFCQDVLRLQALLPTLLQPANGTGILNQVSALVARISTDAPPEIRPAANELVQTERRIIADLSAKPPQLADMARSFTDPAYQQSLQQVGSYAFAHC